ncbi:hypothetical protein RMR16_017320 [Agrobacterium sp. rho-13.3]|uniref:hypothetical protein n=1 Tax=Agrobacterium sp. rho-13.3 TaxID=3072980 RepID=UPI003D7A7784
MLPGPGGEGLRNPFTASTDPASPQRLAVYPKAEQGYYLSGLERVEKVAKILYYVILSYKALILFYIFVTVGILMGVPYPPSSC